MSMRKIYREIAKKHGVSVAEVKREMQAAVDHAYKREDRSLSQAAVQKSIPHSRTIPDAETVILWAAKKVK